MAYCLICFWSFYCKWCYSAFCRRYGMHCMANYSTKLPRKEIILLVVLHVATSPVALRWLCDSPRTGCAWCAQTLAPWQQATLARFYISQMRKTLLLFSCNSHVYVSTTTTGVNILQVTQWVPSILGLVRTEILNYILVGKDSGRWIAWNHHSTIEKGGKSDVYC